MFEFRFDPFNNPAQTEREAEEQFYYFLQLIRGLEAKITRIEPFSEEFDETMDYIYAAKKAIGQAVNIRLMRHYEEATQEFEQRNREPVYLPTEMYNGKSR